MFRLLPRISTFPEGTIKDRAGAVGRDRSTLGRTLRVVERQGRVTLGSTEAGRAALAGTRPMWDAAQARMKAAMGADPNGVPARLERIAALPSDTGARAP